MVYTVYYRKKGFPFARKIKNVIEDGIIPENPEVRYFLLQDGTRIEIPMWDTIFKFSKERSVIMMERNKLAEQNVKKGK